MNRSVGTPDAIRRLNASCQRASQLRQEADTLLEVGDIDSALETLTAARRVEPRSIEGMEILRRIQHLERIDPDWVAASKATGVPA